MRDLDSAGKAPARIAAQTGDVVAAMKTAAKTYSGTFTYHYQMHAPIGPNVAVADVTKDSAIIYSHVKNGYGNTRPQIAAALSNASGRTYDPARVRVIYAEGSSSFGGGAQHVDVGEAAAVLSMGAGKPVRLQFMRWDEHGWDNYGPATMWDIAGGVDANGKLVALDATSFGMSSYAKTPTESMVGQPMTTPGQRARRHDLLRDAVQHPEPADHRQDRGDAEQLLQGVARCVRRTRCRRASPASS